MSLPAFTPAVRRNAPPAICPHLGLADDKLSVFRVPSPANVCWRVSPPGEVEPGHQSQYCLGPQFAECPVYTGGKLAEGVRIRRLRRGPLPGLPNWRAVVVALEVLLVMGVITTVIVMAAQPAPSAPTQVRPTSTLTRTPFSIQSAFLLPTLVEFSADLEATFTPMGTVRSPTPDASPGSPVETTTLTGNPAATVITSDTPAATETLTATLTPAPTDTRTATVTATFTPLPTETPTATSTSTATDTPTVTHTATATHTATLTPAPVNTPIGPLNLMVHTVRAGETLTSIAARYRATTQVLITVNNLRVLGAIRPGQVLVVPVGASSDANLTRMIAHQASEEASLAGIAAQFAVDPEVVRLLNSLGQSDVIPAGRWLFIPQP